MNDIVVSEQRVETPDGWSLHLKRTACPARVQAGAGPLLIVPGYGMNSFIFGFHPRGTSMERTLAEAGLEVWSLDLRAQGRSRPARDRPGPVSLRGYAAIDLPAAVERVLSATATGADRLALIGASLGGSIAYAYLALRPEPRLDALVTMGAPLRWRGTHPVVRLAFGSPRVAAAVRLKHTRTLVRAALPLLTRVPRLLSMYMNAATIDLSRMHEMTRTVDDPSPNVNRELAE
ncbi:MAG: alpha/beta fold hydrolase, partial [Deltaproteobacteria bacterium]|nr:alpha/beta fold hydrolase [Deltaproteobacteria bacterium]